MWCLRLWRKWAALRPQRLNPQKQALFRKWNDACLFNAITNSKTIKEREPIAIYHLSIKIISRGKGQSAVAAAAYRAGEKILNEYDGRLSDYTRKKGIVHTEIMLPNNAPAEFADRAVLWNAVERIEKAKNSQLAREFEISLPVEFTHVQNLNLVREYVKKNFVEHGMCADIAIHIAESKDENGNKIIGGNPHAHIMLTMRPLNDDKTWGDKQKKVYHFDKDGNKIYDPKKRQYKCGKEQTTDWNEQTKAEEWRAAWADIQNQHLEKHGFDVRVDHRSYEQQGIEQIPTIHLGVAAHQMEQRGIRTERGDINRAIKEANEKAKNINAAILKLENELQQIINEQRYEKTQQKQDIPTTTQKTTKTDSTKKPAAQTKTKPTQSPKNPTQSKPLQKPKTLKQVDKEIDLVETKLLDVEHAETVIMLYNRKIEDIQRNLNSVGWWERRKMLKEISTEEQRRDSYKSEIRKKCGTKPKLEKEKSKLLAEKKQIEDATGITAAREHEEQQKWSEALQRKQERERYNAEMQAKRLANPSKNKNDISL